MKVSKNDIKLESSIVAVCIRSWDMDITFKRFMAEKEKYRIDMSRLYVDRHLFAKLIFLAVLKKFTEV